MLEGCEGMLAGSELLVWMASTATMRRIFTIKGVNLVFEIIIHNWNVFADDCYLFFGVGVSKN